MFQRSRRNKYGAKAADGFPSQLHRAVYQMLLMRQTNGEIGEIEREKQVVLQEGPRNVRITWRVDFRCHDLKSDTWFYVEAKGFETKDYLIKLKMWRKQRPARLEIWKGTAARPFLHELIDV